jgi:SAM-dependent methyltransferase
LLLSLYQFAHLASILTTIEVISWTMSSPLIKYNHVVQALFDAVKWSVCCSIGGHMPKYISWVPTQSEYIDTFFELCPVSSSDVVYDLGSGDGRLLFTAVEKGAARCVGIDIDLDLVKAAREAAKSRGMDNKLTFIEADMTAVDLSEASVVFCYVHPAASAALKPKFEKELNAGTRVVMESFPVMNWKPEKVIDNNGILFYLYIMPAEETEDYRTIVGTPIDDEDGYF